MNGFLVLIRHQMDDIPAALLPNRHLAEGAASTIDPMAPEHVREVFKTDASTPICVCIVEFRDGRPVSCDRVRNLTGEKAEA